MKISFEDQYDNWCTGTITIACFYACVKLISQSTVTVRRQKLLRKGAINRLRFSDLT